MKPRNAPGRKNQRRVGALERLNPEQPSRTGKRSRAQAEAEFLTLSKRIVSQAQAESVRTKKTEELGWTAARRAHRRGRLSA